MKVHSRSNWTFLGKIAIPFSTPRRFPWVPRFTARFLAILIGFLFSEFPTLPVSIPFSGSSTFPIRIPFSGFSSHPLNGLWENNYIGKMIPYIHVLKGKFELISHTKFYNIILYLNHFEY